MCRLSAIIGLLFCVIVTRADELPVIQDSDAVYYVGEKVEVRGLVVSVTTSPLGTAFINFGREYPNQTFAGFIAAGSKLADNQPMPAVISPHGADERPGNGTLPSVLIKCAVSALQPIPWCQVAGKFASNPEGSRTSRGFGRKLDAHQVKIYKIAWEQRVKKRREMSDALPRSVF